MTRVFGTGLKIAAFFSFFFLTSYLKQHSANTSATVPKQRLTAIHLFQVNVSLFLSQGQQSTARTFKCHTCELRAAAQMTSLCSYSSFLLGVEHSNTLRDSVPTLCRVPFRILTRATGTKILFNTLFIALNLSFFFFFGGVSFTGRDASTDWSARGPGLFFFGVGTVRSFVYIR